jgi:predicted nucleic acid binding AN1-type Zn finger protein
MARFNTHQNPAGHYTIFNDWGETKTRDTLMCIHCQKHFEVTPGSGTKRGWCRNCGGPLCGKKTCMENCCHFEQMLENMAVQKMSDPCRDTFFKPTRVSTNGLILP